MVNSTKEEEIKDAEAIGRGVFFVFRIIPKPIKKAFGKFAENIFNLILLGTMFGGGAGSFITSCSQGNELKNTLNHLVILEEKNDKRFNIFVNRQIENEGILKMMEGYAPAKKKFETARAKWRADSILYTGKIGESGNVGDSLNRLSRNER